MKTTTTKSFKVCTDCGLFHAVGHREIPELYFASPNEFLSLVSHLDRYSVEVGEAWDDEYEEFSAERCGSCGTTEAGERFGCYAELVEVSP